MSTVRSLSKWPLIVAAAVAVGLPWRSIPAQEAAPAQQEDAEHEILLRGPVHEAFAKPLGAEAAPGMTVEKKPPEPVEEVAPDARPEGDDVSWIPGYWAWDEDRSDFIWVSGVWRKIPPGRRWVPGYWNQTDKGYQWTSGFWADARTAQLEYLPNPPASLEEGPTSPAPSDDYFWVPGCWRYVDYDYRWQPGYWSPYYDNWVWMPHHYAWTPQGCVFVNGFWDYGFYDRGYCFAPVLFHHHHHRHFFRPHHVLSFGSLLHFFVHRHHHHYFFGDFHGHRHFHPWHRYHRDHHHDPLFTHLSHRHRRDGIDFGDRLERWHNHFRDHKDQRPPHTLNDLREHRRRDGDREDGRHSITAREFREVVDGGRDGRFRRLGDGDDQVRRDRSEIRDLSELRRKMERQGDDGRRDGKIGGGKLGDGKDGKTGKAEKTQPRPQLKLPPTQRTVPAERGDARRSPGGSDFQRIQPGGRDSQPETRGFRGDLRQFERPEVQRERPAPQIQKERSAPQIQRERPAPQIQRERSSPPPQIRRSEPSPRPQIQRSAPAPQIQRSAPSPRPQIQRSAPAPRQSAPSFRSGGGGRESARGGGGGRGGSGRGGGGGRGRGR